MGAGKTVTANAEPNAWRFLVGISSRVLVYLPGHQGDWRLLSFSACVKIIQNICSSIFTLNLLSVPFLLFDHLLGDAVPFFLTTHMFLDKDYIVIHSYTSYIFVTPKVIIFEPFDTDALFS